MTAEVMNGLIQMQAEFESQQLVIALVPCRYRVNEGGCIRVAISKNATWYSAFCARHLSSRQRAKALVDTRIKRRNVERLLQRLVDGRPTRSKYAPELLKEASRIGSREPQRKTA